MERTTATNVQLRLYSDSARSTLVDTLDVTVSSSRTYQYIFGATSYNDGYSVYITYDVENLDLTGGGGDY